MYGFPWDVPGRGCHSVPFFTLPPFSSSVRFASCLRLEVASLTVRPPLHRSVATTMLARSGRAEIALNPDRHRRTAAKTPRQTTTICPIILIKSTTMGILLPSIRDEARERWASAFPLSSTYARPYEGSVRHSTEEPTGIARTSGTPVSSSVSVEHAFRLACCAP